MSIGQKLEKVADAVYTKGGLDASPQETVSGGIVAITDISPIEHNVAVKASSDNLLDINAFTMDGATATVNGDSITFKRKDYNLYSAGCSPKLVVGETYTFSIESVSDYDNAGWGWVIHYEDDTRDELNGFKKLSFTKIINKPVKRIFFRVGYGVNTESTLVKPQIKKGTTETGYTPFVPDVSVASVKTLGKNICDYTKFVGNSAVDRENVILDGDTFIFPAGNKYYGLNMKNGLPLVKGQTYTFSYTAITNYAYPECQIRYTDDTMTVANNGKTVTIANKDIKSITFYITNGAFAETDIKLSKFQVEAGSTVTDYEPPIEPTSYPIATDGTVDGVTSIYPNMTITTDTDGVIIEANYYQDGKKVKENLIDMILSLGGVINE